MPHGFVQVAPRDDAHNPAFFTHTDARMAVALGGDEGLGDGSVGVDEADGPAHDLPGLGRRQPERRALQSLQDLLEHLRRTRVAGHSRRRLGMTSATDDVQQTAHIHGAGPRARRDEDALLHPHHLDEDLGIDQFHELMGDDAQALNVVGNIEDHRMHIDAAHPPQLHRVDHAHEGLAMLPGESAVQVTLEERLRGTQPHGGGQHLRIADGGAREGERTGVFVDAEREDGGRQAGDLHVRAPGEGAAWRPHRSRRWRAPSSRP